MKKRITFKTEKRKYKDLVPADYNPRKLSETQIEDLKKSLEKFQMAEIPVINLDNSIIAGHQRIRLSLMIYGEDYEDDVRVPNRLLTKQEEKEYNIRSNKNTGSWDWDILANEFELNDLKDWGFQDFELSGDIHFNEDDFIDEEKKKELEERHKKAICPNCNHEFEL